MRLRKFDNVERVVRESGDDKAKEELEWLLKLARTNFAACYGTGTQGPDAYDAAMVRLGTRLPLIEGGEGYLSQVYLSQVCGWLYAQAKERCTCQAPMFITGCDHTVSAGEDRVDECTCTTGECPWTHHTGVFL